MANHASARKATRQARTLNERNRSARSALRTAIKRLRSAIERKDPAEVRALLSPTLSRIDRSSKKGLLHDNAAARQKSRLSRSAHAVLAASR